MFEDLLGAQICLVLIYLIAAINGARNEERNAGC